MATRTSKRKKNSSPLEEEPSSKRVLRSSQAKRLSSNTTTEVLLDVVNLNNSPIKSKMPPFSQRKVLSRKSPASSTKKAKSVSTDCVDSEETTSVNASNADDLHAAQTSQSEEERQLESPPLERRKTSRKMIRVNKGFLSLKEQVGRYVIASSESELEESLEGSGLSSSEMEEHPEPDVDVGTNDGLLKSENQADRFKEKMIGTENEPDEEKMVNKGEEPPLEDGTISTNNLFPGRSKQMEILSLIIGNPSDWAPPAVFLYGESGVGKTLVIKHILSQKEVPYAYINLAECYSSRILYETVLNSLSGVAPSSDNQFCGYTRCDNISQFVRELCNLVSTQGWSHQSIYIVLDNFERVRSMEPTLLPSLVKLAELTRLNLCVIMISKLVWDKFSSPTGCSRPLQVFFPQYTQREVFEILLGDCPSDQPKPLYVGFLKCIWNILHTITRNINEIRYLSHLLFPIYCQPVLSGKATTNDSLKLWLHLKPFYRKYLSQIYLREIACLDNLQQQDIDTACQPKSLQHSTPFTPTTTTPLVDSLSYFTKYLMIAAYLSSYNPTKCDHQFFSKKRGKKTKKKGCNPKDKEIKRQLVGPRPFTLDRMLMIFHSITEEDIVTTTPLLSQITTLVTLNFLAKISTADSLDILKYKCLVSFEAIREISKSVDFEIVRYLSDYN